MARAAAQTMGIFAAVEGAKFGRRVPALLQIVLPALQKAAQEVSRSLICCYQCFASYMDMTGNALPVACIVETDAVLRCKQAWDCCTGGE